MRALLAPHANLTPALHLSHESRFRGFLDFDKLALCKSVDFLLSPNVASSSLPQRTAFCRRHPPGVDPIKSTGFTPAVWPLYRDMDGPPHASDRQASDNAVVVADQAGQAALPSTRFRGDPEEVWRNLSDAMPGATFEVKWVDVCAGQEFRIRFVNPVSTNDMSEWVGNTNCECRK